MSTWQLALWVLCGCSVLQLVLQTLWSVRNERTFRIQRSDLQALRKRVSDALGPRRDYLESIRELVEVWRRIEAIERQVGIAHYSPPAFVEPSPTTKRTGDL
jgi:hypothetical protein